MAAQLQERRRFKKRAISDKERAESNRKRSKIIDPIPTLSTNSQCEENADIFPDTSYKVISMPMLSQLTPIEAAEMDVDDPLPLLPLDSLLACTSDTHPGPAVEVQDAHQGMQGLGMAEDELAGLLLSSGWDESQLELLDSLLDSL
ncbi:uncharacterized protein LOC113373583 [Ctenocephalides felis]|uniref:uncharacterized protein LOC113373583 n=1 Tax=Ctenocephalides felis TaxID=7515 RepID=UPI000E6E4D74|nr:uncharacterized protein LOC113373583 [Ctenocephalides felis]